MTTTEYDIARRARELIADPRDWIRHRFAETRFHRKVNFTDRRAVRFCLVGAVQRAGYELGAGVSKTGRLLDGLERRIASPRLTIFNDIGSHDRVLELLDEFIQTEDT